MTRFLKERSLKVRLLDTNPTGNAATRLKFIRAGLTPASLLLAASSLAAAQGPASGNAETGAQLFYQHGCYQCHGYSGYGRASLHNPDSQPLRNESDFIAYLRLRADVAPVRNSAAMPNYPVNTVSDAQARDLYAYILAMPQSDPNVVDVPAFQSILESAEKPYTP